MRFASGINNGVGNNLPPSPIGNSQYVQPMGGYNYYNPWDMQRRQEQEIQRQYSEATERLSFTTAYLKLAGYSQEEIDNMLEGMKPKYKTLAEYNDYQREIREEQLFQQAISGPCMPTQIERVEAFLDEKRKEYEKRYEGKSKKEQYEELTKIGLENLEYESRMERRNLTGQYNRTDYRNLISNMNNSSGYIAGNIDDLEIELPGAITDVYAKRRMQFLERVGAGVL